MRLLAVSAAICLIAAGNTASAQIAPKLLGTVIHVAKDAKDTHVEDGWRC
jgi:hypothetical protein